MDDFICQNSLRDAQPMKVGRHDRDVVTGRIAAGDTCRSTAQPRSALTGVFGPTCMQALICQHCIYVSLDEIPPLPPPKKKEEEEEDLFWI